MKNFKIEKDPELESLITKCQKKGLKFGLALGSGSARGMAHIGVIQILEAYHIPIDMIAGTSIGSVVGSVYATGASVEKMKKAALAMKHRKSFSLFDPTIPRSGLISGNRAEEILNKIGLKDKTFDDLKIPFSAVATDIKTGAKVILNQGSVIKAVRASFSIPGIFTPVKYQDYYLVDGGVVDPVPVDVVQKMGANIIIAVSLTQQSPKPIMIINKETGDLKKVENTFTFKINIKEIQKFRTVEKITSLVEKEVTSLGKKIKGVKKKFEGPHIIEVISKSVDIMEKEITSRGLDKADVVIVPFGIESISLFEFDKADITIKGGIDATLAEIPQIKEVIKEKIK
ncbi:MAG: patatin-like phospholipase family protein [Candidatus Caldatribacteriota bacterium]|nr:patatin-like phospholipase family protein [Candidatus Caldatribacteriota bacterium]